MSENKLAVKQDSKKFSVALQSDAFQKLISDTLGDENRKKRFVAAISSAVGQNPDLQNCDAGTVLVAGLVGESLNLSPSPQLGQFYLVPFNDRKNGRIVAQFQIGYKGYLQLAMRSGQYKKINVVAIKKGELINYDPLEEELKVNLIEDELKREKSETTGYYAMFEYLNGFKKTMYWSKQKMEAHATKYSQAYRAKKGFSFWEKDFDGMGFKTMLRQLISKWGIMSTELQEAYTKDMASLDESGNVNYVDNAEVVEEEIQNNANSGEILAFEDNGVMPQPKEAIDDKKEVEETSQKNRGF